jgi:drug/metabolite transporter (DMT)-like permease
MSRRQVAALLALSAIWGASFMFIKVGVRDSEPGALIAVRIGLAALTLLAVVAYRPGLGPGARAARPFLGPLLAVAALNTALPFWLITWAETRIDSGLAAILNASAPLFTALLAWRFARGQQLVGLRLVGVLVGFVGVALLVGFPGGDSDPLAALAVVLAGLCYAGGALYIGERLRPLSPVIVSAGSMVAATVLVAPLGLAQIPDELPGWKPLASVVLLGVVCTGFAYLLYFSLIATAGASRAILVTYLTPALALLYGAVLLDEEVTLVAVGGLALVLGGVALGTGAVRLGARRRLASEQP